MDFFPGDAQRRIRNRVLLVYALPAALIAALAWICYFVASFTGHLASFPYPASTYLIAALVITPLAALYALWHVQRALWLAEHGVQVEGTIMHVGGSFKGLVRIDCSYLYDGQEHNTCWSEAEDVYSPGDIVVLVVDPRRPRRAVLSNTIFGANET